MASDEERAREFMRTINDHNFEAAVRVLTEVLAAVREAALREARARCRELRKSHSPNPAYKSGWNSALDSLLAGLPAPPPPPTKGTP